MERSAIKVAAGAINIPVKSGSSFSGKGTPGGFPANKLAIEATEQL